MSGRFENWVKFAEEDLKMAELALKEKMYNPSCFHSQQCVEKVLKGFIEYKGKIHPHTHKLADVLSSLSTDIFEDSKDDIILLDRFYVPTRYPDALPGVLPEGLPSEKDAKEALETARVVLERAKKALGGE